MFKFRSFLRLFAFDNCFRIVVDSYHNHNCILYSLELLKTESDEKMSEPIRKKNLIIGGPNVGKDQGSTNRRRIFVRK